MTRSLLSGVALVSVAAGAVLWAASPDCEGGLCIDRGVRTEVRQVGAGASAVPGTGRDVQLGRVDETVPGATSADRPYNEATSEPWGEAAEAFEGWQDDTAASMSGASDGSVAEAQVAAYRDPKPSYRQKRARLAAQAKAAKRWQGLAEAALNEPDDELRGAAINTVALHRNADAVTVLNEVAALDPAPNNRLQAIQQLWYSAADGLDPDGDIESTLKAALDDPDDAVAALAEKALADLQALEEAREEAQAFN